ncbi:tropinone reductase homolog At5g06060-like [Prunus avium]|uniref:Tropinone reductase homolog At5g06060-like n=1 Tax=Prunus avium TaxID=42229 RepID=A0A6P5S617_PRUAV|nr:tropinone reductase homolog At5g06060-like [Prunus avium]
MAQANSTGKDSRWSLHGMTALVTGGTKGIGYTIVEELARLGATIHTCSRNEVQLNDCLSQWKMKGFEVTGSVCDVVSKAQPKELINKASSLFYGKLNILINNVGTAELKPSIESTTVANPVHFNTSISGAMDQLAKNLACEWAKDNIRTNSVAPWFIKTPLTELHAHSSSLWSLHYLQLLSNQNFLEAVNSRCPLGRIGEPKEVSALVAFLYASLQRLT